MSGQDVLSFGAVLRHRRLVAGLTQEALAERSGLGLRSIQGLERGETQPRRDPQPGLTYMGVYSRAIDQLHREPEPSVAVLAAIEQLNAQGITLIVVTHDDEVGNRARRHLRMRDGKVVDDYIGTRS